MSDTYEITLNGVPLVFHPVTLETTPDGICCMCEDAPIANQEYRRCAECYAADRPFLEADRGVAAKPTA